jgi:hypothetical protein
MKGEENHIMNSLFDEPIDLAGEENPMFIGGLAYGCYDTPCYFDSLTVVPNTDVLENNKIGAPFKDGGDEENSNTGGGGGSPN